MKVKEQFDRAKRAFSQMADNINRVSTWNNLLYNNMQWEVAKKGASPGQRVLLATSMGGYDNGAMLESALAVALTLRSANAEVLLCDQFLPACQMTKITKISPDELIQKGQTKLCNKCFKSGMKIFKPSGLKINKYSEFVNSEQKHIAKAISTKISYEDIGDYAMDGIAVGEHALAGALRYYARGNLNGEPLGERILRTYLEASLLSTLAIQGLFQLNKYDVACFNHGIYVPQGLIGEVCRQQGIRVVNSNPAYRNQTFIFSHGDTYHHTMISEVASEWENIPWTHELEKKTLDYLKSRWIGTQDWIWFHEDPKEEVSQITKEVGVNFSKPCIGMLTSVMWDAQLHYKSNAFQNMLEWVIQTIAYFSRRPELQLIIRVHPAEVRGMIPSRQPIVVEIQHAFPNLPPNVFIIPPESKISTYAVMEKCNSIIIYNTKTGIEISSMGIPVIVAGEAWIRNKGFSLDASSPAEYFQILDRLPLATRLGENELERAQKYAFHFFFRRMIPLPFITSPQKYKFALKISDINELLPGKHQGLDVVCDGILRSTPFTYPAEKI